MLNKKTIMEHEKQQQKKTYVLHCCICSQKLSKQGIACNSAIEHLLGICKALGS